MLHLQQLSHQTAAEYHDDDADPRPTKSTDQEVLPDKGAAAARLEPAAVVGMDKFRFRRPMRSLGGYQVIVFYVARLPHVYQPAQYRDWH